MNPDFLCWLRKFKGVSQPCLAKKLRLSTSYVCLIEKGQRPLNRDLQTRIIRALDIDESQLPRLREMYREMCGLCTASNE
ncbi:helix-turn-helix domain-containing protein [Alicyclobacillus fastidiosus]